MFRKIFLSVIIYPLAALLFGFYYWGESRTTSQSAPGGGEAVAVPVGDPAPVHSSSKWMLLEGTSLETPVYLVSAPEEGPVVLVIGGIHGDEPAGYLAAEIISSWVVDRGTLIVIPRANIPAILIRRRMGVDMLDLNRSFPGQASGTPTRQLAAAIYDIMLEFKPDWVVDLHEAREFERVRAGALGQTIIHSPESGSMDIIEEMLNAVNRTIKAPGDYFLQRRGLLKGTSMYAGASIGAEPIIVETCKRLPLHVRVGYHLQAVVSLLYLLGVAVY